MLSIVIALITTINISGFSQLVSGGGGGDSEAGHSSNMLAFGSYVIAAWGGYAVLGSLLSEGEQVHVENDWYMMIFKSMNRFINQWVTTHARTRSHETELFLAIYACVRACVCVCVCVRVRMCDPGTRRYHLNSDCACSYGSVLHPSRCLFRGIH